MGSRAETSMRSTHEEAPGKEAVCSERERAGSKLSKKTLGVVVAHAFNPRTWEAEADGSL